MIAITTRYSGRSGRIIATTDKHRKSMSEQQAIREVGSSGEAAHAYVAASLARGLNWRPNEMVSGWTKDGYVFVFTASTRYDVETGKAIS